MTNHNYQPTNHNLLPHQIVKLIAYVYRFTKKLYAKENDIPVQNGFFLIKLFFKPNKQRSGLCLKRLLSSTNRIESGRAKIQGGPLLLQVTI